LVARVVVIGGIKLADLDSLRNSSKLQMG